MDGVTLQQIRNALLDRRRNLLERDAPRREIASHDLSENQAEIIDIAQALEQLKRDHSLAEKERRELIAIERSLTKIATGRFGICEECEEEILEKRLQVLPTARLCARCQALEERVARTTLSVV